MDINGLHPNITHADGIATLRNLLDSVSLIVSGLDVRSWSFEGLNE